ncbi:hypothetical protein VNI00_011209 [Paramarasmius palmivorus]|uniref:HNH nuclease domain-containing protein n=1 Tax=Paramarasmius palmivorus TaxID=297713 RepID=A0AAW0CEK6_9AGAR
MALDAYRLHPPKPLQYGDSNIRIFISVSADPALDITVPGNRLWTEDALLTFPKTFLHSLDLNQNNWIPWLRYASYTITGQPGFLSLTPDGTEIIMQPATTLSTSSLDLYYHPDSDVICIIDPDLDSVLSSSVGGPRRPSFRSDVVARDRQCIWTGFPSDSCEAAHIVRHNNDLPYIARLLATRDTNETFEDIDDVRNGLLLSRDYHAEFARGKIAFIRTPIPGIITSSDLHASHQPLDDILTIHYIKQDIYDTTHPIVFPPNHTVPTPGPGTNDALSHALLDCVYGYHLLNQFGNVKLAKELFEDMTERYYGAHGPLDRGGKGEEERRKEKEKEDKRERQKEERQRRLDNRRRGRPDVECTSDLEEGDGDKESEPEVWHPPRNFEDATMQDFLRLLRWSYTTSRVHKDPPNPAEKVRDKVEAWKQTLSS